MDELGHLESLELKYASADTAAAIGTTGTTTPLSLRSVGIGNIQPAMGVVLGGRPPASTDLADSSAAEGAADNEFAGVIRTSTARRQQELWVSQQQVLSNLLRVRALVAVTKTRIEQQRIHEFLNACCDGNLDTIRVVSWH